MSRKQEPAVDVDDLGPSTVAWTKAHRLTSRTLGRDFLIEVAWPPVPITVGRRFPVVYVLDGNHAFALTTHIARSLQSGPFPLPPTLVVGIGYHFARPADRAAWGALRTLDFTPCGDALYEARSIGAPGPTGGAAAFLNFIETEVKPFIGSRFPVDLDDQTLVGSSLGGLFSLYTLFTSPASFRRYLALSPAIYWGEHKLFELEAALAARASDLSAHLFLSAGGLEEAHDGEQRFVSNVYQLEAALRRRRYAGLDMNMHIFDGETHMSVYPAAASRGLATVFGGHRDMSDWSRWLEMAREATPPPD